MRRRSIDLFCLDGDRTSIKVAQIAMLMIQAIAFRQNQQRRVRDTIAEIEQPGVYILIGGKPTRSQITSLHTLASPRAPVLDWRPTAGTTRGETRRPSGSTQWGSSFPTACRRFDMLIEKGVLCRKGLSSLHNCLQLFFPVRGRSRGHGAKSERACHVEARGWAHVCGLVRAAECLKPHRTRGPSLGKWRPGQGWCTRAWGQCVQDALFNEGCCRSGRGLGGPYVNHAIV